MRNLALFIAAFVVGLAVGKISSTSSSTKGPDENSIRTSAREPAVNNKVVAIENGQTPARTSHVTSQDRAVAQRSVAQAVCKPEDFSVEELKKAWEDKSEDFRKNVLNAKFPIPRNEAERKKRRDSFAPEIAALLKDSRAWIADWSVNVDSESIPLTIIWAIHDGEKGFGIEVFAPDKKQLLGLGTTLDYASPVDDLRYAVFSVTDKDVDRKIPHLAIALPSANAKSVPSQYLLPGETNWRDGPSLSWKPISETELTNFRNDAYRRNQAN